MHISFDLDELTEEDVLILRTILDARFPTVPEVSFEPPALTVVPFTPPPETGKDVHGVPWDARIHSASKATNKDGSWRMRKNVDDAEVKLVMAEIAPHVQQSPAPVEVVPPPPPAPLIPVPPPAQHEEPDDAIPAPPVHEVDIKARFQSAMKRIQEAQKDGLLTMPTLLEILSKIEPPLPNMAALSSCSPEQMDQFDAYLAIYAP